MIIGRQDHLMPRDACLRLFGSTDCGKVERGMLRLQRTGLTTFTFSIQLVRHSITIYSNCIKS